MSALLESVKTALADLPERERATYPETGFLYRCVIIPREDAPWELPLFQPWEIEGVRLLTCKLDTYAILPAEMLVNELEGAQSDLRIRLGEIDELTLEVDRLRRHCRWLLVTLIIVVAVAAIEQLRGLLS